MLLNNREFSAAVQFGVYPEQVEVPLDEAFENSNGKIQNLLLENFASAALITSHAGAIRANHYHKTDWHYAYVLSGKVEYYWRNVGSDDVPKSKIFVAGKMFFTPPMLEHAMSFHQESTIITFAKNIRDTAHHETKGYTVAIPYKDRTSCGLCVSKRLDKVLELFPTPLANEFVKEDSPVSDDKVPLTLVVCRDCQHVQLREIVDPKRLFENYVYVSGTSREFVRHFHELAASCVERFCLDEDSFIVDIGSNDGTLLKQFQQLGKCSVLGIDPAVEIVKDATRNGVPTLCGYFNASMAAELHRDWGAAKLVTANNVFAHVSDLKGFASGVSLLLDKTDGVFVFEVSYFVDVLNKLLFDTIYHEHTAYHTLWPLQQFFDKLGMKLFDVETLESHGGSVRCFAAHKSSTYSETSRLKDLLYCEAQIDWISRDIFEKFASRISVRGQMLRHEMALAYSEGKKLAGFGAPAKLTTLMHQFQLAGHQFEFVVDDSPLKQGLLTPGMRIPVVPSNRLRDETVVIFAWNFANSIIAKNQEYLARGGTFIIPLPVLRKIHWRQNVEPPAR